MKFEQCQEMVYREQKRHIKVWHTKLCPVTPEAGDAGRAPGQKYLCSLGSEDSTKYLTPGHPIRRLPPTGRSPANKIYVYVPFSFLSLEQVARMDDNIPNCLHLVSTCRKRPKNGLQQLTRMIECFCIGGAKHRPF